MNNWTPTRIAERVIVLEGWRAALLAVLAGAISALGLAPFHFFPVIIVTFPLLVWLLDGAVAPVAARGVLGPLRRYWPAFRTGWFFGFGYFLAGLWWVGQAFLIEADEFGWLLPLAVVALPAGLALFYGAATALARLAWGEGWIRIVALAATLTFAEWVRGTVLTGFPWNALGTILMPSPLFMQSAALFGTYAVTFLTVFIGAAPAIFAPGAGTYLESGLRRPRRVRAVLAAALILFAAHAGYGFWRLSGADNVFHDGVNIRIVQPGVLQTEKWQPENADMIMQRYLDLSNSNRGPKASSAAAFTHIVWPESAFPFILTQRREVLASIASLLAPSSSLITGAMRLEPAPEAPSGRDVFNSLYVIDSDGEIVSAYDKTRLLPFGEFLPFQAALESVGLRQLTQLQGGFAQGSRRSTMEAPNTPPFLPLICYEIIYPGKVRGIGTEPQWIVNVTNDAWFGNTPGPYQHAHQSRIRAVEEGLPVVRAANSGISLIADAHGRVLGSLALGERGVVDGPLPRSVARPLFSRSGNLPVLAFVCILFGILVAVQRATNRRL